MDITETIMAQNFVYILTVKIVDEFVYLISVL